MARDAQDHELTGATTESATLFDQSVRSFNLFYGDPLAPLKAALNDTPQFTMVHLAKGWLLVLTNDPTLAKSISSTLETAQNLATNDREKGHLAALKLAAQGSRQAAVALLDRHLMSYPHDILAHQAATFLSVYYGRVASSRDRSARALPLWTRDMPGYATLLGYYGFGLEEGSEYAQAEDVSRQSLELEPKGFIPHHTVSHCMEMTGRPEDGLDWMAGREAYWATPENGFQSHVWWHKSLFQIELGQFAAALSVYDGPLLTTMRPLGTRLCDPVALLWRLDILGCEVGNRWRDLLPLLDGHSDGKCLVFTDMHAAMAELRSGNEALVELRLEWMRSTAAGSGEAAVIYRNVGIPLVDGLVAFHKGDYGRAVAQLLPIRADLWLIGGSNAQRDIVDCTLTEAAIRGGIGDVAIALANERLGTRPRSCVNRHFQSASMQIGVVERGGQPG